MNMVYPPIYLDALNLFILVMLLCLQRLLHIFLGFISKHFIFLYNLNKIIEILFCSCLLLACRNEIDSCLLLQGPAHAKLIHLI